jgi:prophage endopeptidase
MLSLLNPQVLMGIVLALASAFFYGHHVAYVEQQEEIERIGVKMKDEAAATTAKLEKEKRDAQIKVDQLRADVAAGAVRLSVRASCSAGAAGGDSEARAELDPKVADDLIAITADGDQAIIELNTCIDFYNKLREIK